MKIAVINVGSSSLKFKLFDMKTKEILHSVLVEKNRRSWLCYKNTS